MEKLQQQDESITFSIPQMTRPFLNLLKKHEESIDGDVSFPNKILSKRYDIVKAWENKNELFKLLSNYLVR